MSAPTGLRWRAQALAVRMAVYALTFLALVLLALPWFADRLGRELLPWQVEVGPLRTLGWGLAGASLVAYAWCASWLVRQGAGAYVEFDPPTRLVTTGPYSRCRNPVALSLLGTLAGLALGLSSLGVGALAIAAIGIARFQVVWIEEPRLAQRFGAAYAQYVARVPRWSPLGRRAGPL